MAEPPPKPPTSKRPNISRPQFPNKPRTFVHVFCKISDNNYYMHYLPELDSYFYTGIKAYQFQDTTIWHCDPQCYDGYINLYSKDYIQEFNNEHGNTFNSLPGNPLFIFYSADIRGLSTMWFPCPHCVLTNNHTYNITASTSNAHLHVFDVEEDSGSYDDEIGTNITDSTQSITYNGPLNGNFNSGS